MYKIVKYENHSANLSPELFTCFISDGALSLVQDENTVPLKLSVYPFYTYISK